MKIDKTKINMQYHKLNSDLIVDTVRVLTHRIHERFPNSGLSKVSQQLEEITCKAKERATAFNRPIWILRLPLVMLSILLLLIPFLIYTYMGEKATGVWSLIAFFRDISFAEFVQVFESGANDIIIVGAAIYFISSFEGRIKRDRALKAMHEIRSICHIIDMHQLTKDPERLIDNNTKNTTSSPKRMLNRFELGRYLDYCSELLSLTGKVAALYVQDYRDPIAIDAVNDIEQLSTGLAQKIWQKIMLLHTLPLQESSTSGNSRVNPITGTSSTSTTIELTAEEKKSSQILVDTKQGMLKEKVRE